MSAASAIEIRADLGLMPAQLRCLAGALDPACSPANRRIELHALDALCEIQRMVDAARVACRAKPADASFKFRLDMTP